MSRPLEENIDYHALNKVCSDGLLARLAKFHNEPPKRGEPIPAEFDSDDLAPRTMMVRRIQQLVCREFNVSMKDMLSPYRKAQFVRARQAGYYLAKQLTMLSLPAIGKKFGGRDHTTILHGARVTAERIATDKDLAISISRIEEQCR
jgi:chromosomal replication initiation ATPase DnaA